MAASPHPSAAQRWCHQAHSMMRCAPLTPHSIGPRMTVEIGSSDTFGCLTGTVKIHLRSSPRPSMYARKSLPSLRMNGRLVASSEALSSHKPKREFELRLQGTCQSPRCKHGSLRLLDSARRHSAALSVPLFHRLQRMRTDTTFSVSSFVLALTLATGGCVKQSAPVKRVSCHVCMCFSYGHARCRCRACCGQ